LEGLAGENLEEKKAGVLGKKKGKERAEGGKLPRVKTP